MGVVSGASGLGFGVAFTLRDNFTRTADKIERKFKSLEGTTDTATRKIAGGMQRMNKGFKTLAVGAVLAAPFILGVSAAIKFEDAFTGVRKTVELSEPGFARLESNIRNMSKEIPVSATELSGIGEIAGQLGVVGVDNISKFIKTVAMIKETTNLTGDAAATSFARIANIMDEPIANVDKMASSVVFLGNNFATTETEITEFATRIAGAGKIAKISTSDIFAIGAAMSSVGVQAEAGGTAVQKVLLEMNTAVATNNKKLGTFAKTAGLSTQAFKNLAPIQRFQQFVTGLGKQGDGAVLSLKALGLQDQRLIRSFLSLANAGTILEDSITDANKAFTQNTALTEEANKRFETFSSQWKVLVNIINDAFISIGQALLPALKLLIAVLKPVANLFSVLINTQIGKFLVGLVAGVAALTLAFGLYNLVMGAASVATGLFMSMIAPLLPVLLPIIAVVAALAGIFMFAKNSLEAFKGVMSGGEVKGGFVGFMQKVGGVIAGVMAIWKSATTEGFSLSKTMFDSLKKLGILEFVLAIGTFIVRVKAFFAGFVIGLKEGWRVVKLVFNSIVDGLRPVVKAFDKFLGGALKRIIDGFKKAQSGVSTWMKVGKALGIVIVALLVAPLVLLAAVLGIVILAIGLMLSPVIAVILIFKNWGTIVDWLATKWHQLVETIRGFAIGLKEFFVSIPEKFFNLGKSIVLAIKEGIVSAWSSLKTFISGLLDNLIPSQVIDFITGASDLVETGAVSPIAGGGNDQLNNINQTGANNQANSNRPIVNVTAPSVTAQSGQVNITVDLDGEKIAEAVADAESLNASRQ